MHRRIILGCNGNLVRRWSLMESLVGIGDEIHHHLLQLMRVGRGHREVGSQIQVDTNIVHAQVVISKSQGFLEGLIHLHGNALRLVLARKAQEVLHDAVGALRLLVKFLGVFNSLRA